MLLKMIPFEELTWVQKLGTMLIRSALFRDTSKVNLADARVIAGTMIFILIAFTVTQLFTCRYYLEERTTKVSTKYKTIYFLLSVVINILITLFVAVLGLQFGAGGFIAIGLVYILSKGIAGTIQDGPSMLGITSSLAKYYSDLTRRNTILQGYQAVYDEELSKSNDIWETIKQ